jgi:hypothetical protein
VTADIPHQVHAFGEVREAAAIEHQFRFRVENLDRLSPAPVIKIQAVDRYLMRRLVWEVSIDVERV